MALTLQAVATFFAAYIIGYVRFWKLTLILTSTIVAIALTGALLGRLSVDWTRRSLASYALGGSLVEEVISTIRNAIAAGTQERLVVAYDKHLEAAEKPAFKVKTTTTAIIGFMMCYVYLSYALAFWLGSRYISAGECSLSDVLTILLAIMMGAFALGNVAPNMQAFTTGVAAASRIYSTMERISPINPTVDDGDRIPPTQFRGNIEFNRVKHVYPSRPDVVALDSVSFTVVANKITALVGASGSGKSTVVGLLERFYQPVGGEILVDGHNIENLNLRWLRQQIGLVSQEPILFATTIAQNIRHGLIGTQYESLPDDDERISELICGAAKTAFADEFICDLPQGYQTNVGDRGSLLSGGQKQRIAIARAIVGNPKLLIMDEATSALDTNSERIVQAALERAAQNRTTIMIAHRLSTVKKADNIIIMAHGKIVEQGSHSDLLSAEGVYHGLVEAQKIVERSEADLEDIGNVEGGSHEETKSLKSVLASELEEKADLAQADYTTNKLAGTHDSEAHSPQYTLWQLISAVAALNKPDWPYMLTGILCAIITGAGVPVQSVFFAKSVAYLALPQTAAVKSQISFWSWLFVMLAFVQLLAFSTQAYVMAWCSEKLVRRARNLCFRAILRQDAAYFDRPENSSGALTAFLGNTSNVCVSYFFSRLYL